jgi:hypothetical protein
VDIINTLNPVNNQTPVLSYSMQNAHIYNKGNRYHAWNALTRVRKRDPTWDFSSSSARHPSCFSTATRFSSSCVEADWGLGTDLDSCVRHKAHRPDRCIRCLSTRGRNPQGMHTHLRTDLKAVADG